MEMGTIKIVFYLLSIYNIILICVMYIIPKYIERNSYIILLFQQNNDAHLSLQGYTASGIVRYTGTQLQ